MDYISCESGIVEWRPSKYSHNLGDHLAWLIGERVFSGPAWSRMLSEEKRRYILLGSFLCDYNLDFLLSRGYLPVLVGCGYRGEDLSPQKLRKSVINGCRGLSTAGALERAGLKIKPIGDPAIILPLLVPKGDYFGGTILIPHICDEERCSAQASDAGVDEIIQAETTDIKDLVELVKKISSAKFVLAGAMHAAVIAHAYGVPFAFYARNGGYLDCPAKWEDWLSSVSSGGVACEFHSHMALGEKWHRQSARRLKPGKLFPIVAAYSKVGKVRLQLVVRALFFDFLAWCKGRHWL